jgi:hypothetical protein
MTLAVNNNSKGTTTLAVTAPDGGPESGSTGGRDAHLSLVGYGMMQNEPLGAPDLTE